MKKLLLVSLVVVMLSVVLVGCGGCANESEDYSQLIGTWQGYAIAVTQTVVITDVQGDMITFYFENISSIAPEFNTTTSVMTMPVMDNQITAPNEIMTDTDGLLAQEITLTFYDDHIRYEISGFEDIWWTLTRIN